MATAIAIVITAIVISIISNNNMNLAYKSKNKHEKTQKQLQLGEKIKKLASGFFLRQPFYLSSKQEVQLTAIRADISPDLQNCIIYVHCNSDILSGLQTKEQEEIFTDIAFIFKKHLANKGNLRKIPNIKIITI